MIEIKSQGGRLAITRGHADPEHAQYEGITPARAYLEQSEHALVILLTNGFSELVFKADLAWQAQAGRIAGTRRIRLPRIPSSPTSMARLEKVPAYRQVERKEPTRQRASRGPRRNAGGPGGGRKAMIQFADPRYAPLEVKIAQEALKACPETRPRPSGCWPSRDCSSAARQAGKADLAREAEVRLDRLKRTLAEEKKPVTGPITAEPYPGRSDPRHDRVVLLELFTGAECGPCVAADLAFDALSGAYRPTELITLEYHLHIPRPDPLTGPDSVARAAYYEVHSTPSTRFNGEPAALHGGPAEHARSKLNQYRSVIDEMLRTRAGRRSSSRPAGRASRSGSRPRPRFEARGRRARRACPAPPGAGRRRRRLPRGEPAGEPPPGRPRLPRGRRRSAPQGRQGATSRRPFRWTRSASSGRLSPGVSDLGGIARQVPAGPAADRAAAALRRRPGSG